MLDKYLGSVTVILQYNSQFHFLLNKGIILIFKKIMLKEYVKAKKLISVLEILILRKLMTFLALTYSAKSMSYTMILSSQVR